MRFVEERFYFTGQNRLCPHTVLYVTPWEVAYRRFEDIFGRRYEDVLTRSNI